MVTSPSTGPDISQASLDRSRLTTLLRDSLRKVERNGRRLTQKHLAEELGKAEQTVSRWFRGDTTPSDRDLEQLRRALAWTNEQYASLYLPGESVYLEAFGVQRPFPDLLPLIDDPDYLPFDPLSRAAHPGAHVHLDRDWVVSTQSESVIHDLLRSSTGALVTADTGHGVTSAAMRLLMGLRDSAVLRRSLVLHASIESMAGVPYSDLLQSARELFERTHPLAGVGRWNPDRDWVATEADEEAKKWLIRAGDPVQVQQHLDRTFSEQVARSLVLQPWEQVLPAQLHDSILSLASIRRPYETRAGDTEQDSTVRQQRVAWQATLARILGESPLTEQAWQQLRMRAPRLDGRHYLELLADLRRVGVQVTVVWDLSPTPVGRFPLDQYEPESLTPTYLQAVETLASRIRAFTTGQPELDVNNLVLVPREAAHLLTRDSTGVRDDRDLGHVTVDDLARMWRRRYRELKADGGRGTEIIALATAGLPYDLPASITTATALAAAKLSRPAPVEVLDGPLHPDEERNKLLDQSIVSSMVARLVRAQLGNRPIRADPELLEAELRGALSESFLRATGKRTTS